MKCQVGPGRAVPQRPQPLKEALISFNFDNGFESLPFRQEGNYKCEQDKMTTRTIVNVDILIVCLNLAGKIPFS
jgi:hypothetical protein